MMVIVKYYVCMFINKIGNIRNIIRFLFETFGAESEVRYHQI